MKITRNQLRQLILREMKNAKQLKEQKETLRLRGLLRTIIREAESGEDPSEKFANDMTADYGTENAWKQLFRSHLVKKFPNNPSRADDESSSLMALRDFLKDTHEKASKGDAEATELMNKADNYPDISANPAYQSARKDTQTKASAPKPAAAPTAAPASEPKSPAAGQAAVSNTQPAKKMAGGGAAAGGRKLPPSMTKPAGTPPAAPAQPKAPAKKGTAPKVDLSKDITFTGSKSGKIKLGTAKNRCYSKGKSDPGCQAYLAHIKSGQ